MQLTTENGQFSEVEKSLDYWGNCESIRIFAGHAPDFGNSSAKFKSDTGAIRWLLVCVFVGFFGDYGDFSE